VAVSTHSTPLHRKPSPERQDAKEIVPSNGRDLELTGLPAAAGRGAPPAEGFQGQRGEALSFAGMGGRVSQQSWGRSGPGSMGSFSFLDYCFERL
jgi:hypothetical protein